MANNDKNDKELNNYLDGNSELSKQYRASRSAEPPSHLDDAILSAANKAVIEKEQKPKKIFHKSPWAKPVSIAAIITLSVSLVVTMQQETGQPLISEPDSDLEIYDSAVLSEDLVAPKSVTTDDDISIKEEVQLKKSNVERSDVAAPAALGAVGGYRAESKTGGMKEEAAIQSTIKPEKKVLLKEKARSSKLKKQEKFDDVLIRSMPAEVVPNTTMGSIGNNDSKEQGILTAIKSLWEIGDKEAAQLIFEDFIKSYPKYSVEQIKEKLGTEIYQALIQE